MTMAPTQLTAAQQDVDAVTQAARDYLEGYVQGDPDRHLLAYHPECVKRRFATDPDTGVEGLLVLSPQVMADYAATVGAAHAEAEWEIVVDDICEGMASVRVYSTHWVDFLHVVRARGAWRILHATWHGREG